MILRKNISLNEEYLKKLKPLMEKHNGNLSAAIREVIDLADASLKDPDSLKRLISGLKKEQNLTSATLTWSLKNLTGRLPDREMVMDLIGRNIISVSSLQKYMDELGGEIYWRTSVKIESDDDIRPTKIFIMITGNNSDMNRFLAGIVAVFAMEQFNVGLLKIHDMKSSLNLEMVSGNKEWALKSLTENLGYMDSAVSEIYSKPKLWHVLTKLYKKTDYNMVAISKYFFDGLLVGEKLPKITTCFERYYGAHISSIPPEDFIKKLYTLYSSMGIIELIDIDNDSLIIHHSLTDPAGIKKLADIFVELFRLNGQIYNSEVDENLIVLKHMPDMGNKFAKKQDNLSKNNGNNGEFKTNILEKLPVLIPFDEEVITSLGFDFGKTTIQNYEQEQMVEKWEINSFIEFVQYISEHHEIDIKWKSVNENTMDGIIMACPAKEEIDNTNIVNCSFIKGMFDSFVMFAFGERAEVIHELNTLKIDSETGGCEIHIRDF